MKEDGSWFLWSFMHLVLPFVDLGIRMSQIDVLPDFVGMDVAAHRTEVFVVQNRVRLCDANTSEGAIHVTTENTGWSLNLVVGQADCKSGLDKCFLIPCTRTSLTKEDIVVVWTVVVVVSC